MVKSELIERVVDAFPDSAMIYCRSCAVHFNSGAWHVPGDCFAPQHLALPVATGDLAERKATIDDAIERRAEALGFDYGALRVDPAMSALRAASDEVIAELWSSAA